MNNLTINPGTLMIEGFPDRRLTAAEISQITPPPCPVCATPVRVDWVDVTYAAEWVRGDHRYMAGRWGCPHGCDPRTGPQPG